MLTKINNEHSLPLQPQDDDLEDDDDVRNKEIIVYIGEVHFCVAFFMKL